MALLVYSVTLEISGAPVVVVFDVLFCIALSVILINCRISSPPLPFPKFLIALAQSAVVDITLSSCVTLGWVSYFWLKVMVSVKCSLLVNFMWHICV